MAPELTEKQNKLLHKIYYEDKYYFGRDRIFALLQDKYPKCDISRRQVMDWLKKQEIAQLFKPTRTTKDIKPTILSKPYSQIAVDLADMQTMAYNGYQYILCCVDLFSKYAWVEPLKDKTEKLVTPAMKTILKRINHPIGSIRSDNGSEFIANSFKKLLQDNDIKQVFSDAGKPQSNGGIERFNGTLKRLIKMTRTQTDNEDWVTPLQILVKNYNNTKSRITGQVPASVQSSQSDSLHKNVEENIKKKVIKKNEDQSTKFEIGDTVRLKLESDKHQKSNELWTTELFIIYRVFKPKTIYTQPYYYVEGEDGTKYTEKLYHADLQKVTDIDTYINAVEKFTVSKILDKRTHQRRIQYLVKYTNYPHPEWVDRTDLMKDIPKKIKAFEKSI